MADKPTWEQIERDRDEPVNIPLEADEALRALLKVDPESEPVDETAPAARSQPKRG
jgi:hypothetical protein